VAMYRNVTVRKKRGLAPRRVPLTCGIRHPAVPVPAFFSHSFLAAITTLFAALGALAADARREICFPDLPGFVTLKCDFHTHTVFSDGNVWPTVRIDEAWREGLDAIAVTDHVEYRPHKADVGDNLNRSFEIMEDRARQQNILVIRGAELTHDTPPGHFNAIFISDAAALNVTDFYTQFEQAAQQGAFIFWNHPGWKGPERGRWGDEQTRLFEKGWLKGIEICNENDYYREAHQWAVEKRLTLVGNADIHDPSPTTPWTPEQHRTLTLVFAHERSLAALQAALVEGRTAVWCQNRLYGRESELAALFAAAVRVHPPHHRASEDVWVRIDNACELDLDLERTGNVGPDRLRLPARAAIIVRTRGRSAASADELRYKVSNIMIAPDRPLPVQLTIPEQ
jgi:3',5'-nucleoside bisphosphate phosphatase